MHEYNHLFIKNQLNQTVGYMLHSTHSHSTDERLLDIWRSTCHTHIQDDNELRLVERYARDLIDSVLQSATSIVVESKIERPDVIEYQDQQWMIIPQSANLHHLKESTPFYLNDVVHEVKLFSVTSRMIERYLNTEYLLSAVRSANATCK